jgi:DNA-binding NarL/FixJ family response regulator
MDKRKFPEAHNCEDGNRTRILLADDHKILRSGLRSLIERQPHFHVVAEAEHGKKAVRLADELRPDVVLMDISMPDLNGVDATRRILEKSPATKIIILSVHSSRRFVSEVFKAGASGYLSKNCSFEELVSAISAVLSGGTYLCPKIATTVREDYVPCPGANESEPSPMLSSREREVLQLLAEGKSTKEIAFSLDLSVKTIEAHRQRIMDKLDIHSIAQLTKYAIREGLTSEGS